MFPNISSLPSLFCRLHNYVLRVSNKELVDWLTEFNQHCEVCKHPGIWECIQRQGIKYSPISHEITSFSMINSQKSAWILLMMGWQSGTPCSFEGFYRKPVDVVASCCGSAAELTAFGSSQMNIRPAHKTLTLRMSLALIYYTWAYYFRLGIKWCTEISFHCIELSQNGPLYRSMHNPASMV